MSIDRAFTDRLQAWLSLPRESRNVEEGATYLLQLTRNRHLFAFCMSGKPTAMDKLEYELNKHLLIRLNGHTMDDVLRMSNQLMPAVGAMLARGAAAGDNFGVSGDNFGVSGDNFGVATEATIPHPEALYVGKRADHDALPSEVQSLYTENFDRYVRIKELYNHLLALEQAEPCDRYEYLQLLAEQDRAYREAWEAYDAYVMVSGSDASGSDVSGSDVSESDASGSDVSESDASGSDVSGSDVSESDVSESDASGSDVSGSDVSGSDASGSDASGSDVSGSDVSESDVSGSDASGSSSKVKRTKRAKPKAAEAVPSNAE